MKFVRTVAVTAIGTVLMFGTASAGECVQPSQVPSFPEWVSSAGLRPLTLKELMEEQSSAPKHNTVGQFQAKWGSNATGFPLISVTNAVVSFVGSTIEYPQQTGSELKAVAYNTGAWAAMKPHAEAPSLVDWYVRIVDERKGRQVADVPCLYVHEAHGTLDMKKGAEVHGTDSFGASPVEWKFYVGTLAH